MKQNKVVRTYPSGYMNSTTELNKLLEQGWLVVMCNTFECKGGSKGNEYILEKNNSQ